MNSSNRVGPYTIRRRFRGLGPGSGRVYEAVHAETGASVVLVSAGPGEEWRPEARLDIRVAASPEQGVLALESGSGQDVNLPELTLALSRLAAATARLEGRPDAAAHLGQQVARRERRPRRPRWVLWTMLVGGMAAVMAWPLCAERQALPAAPTATDTVPVSGAVDSPEVIGRDMPGQPFPGQKRPPCTPRSQVEVNGACWMVLKVPPPCPPDVVEHVGECYVPVFTAPRPPTSVDP